MCSEEYSITWSDHHRSVMGMFGRFLDEDILVDCTIASEGKCLKAHRLMLSACSPYFELLFSREKKDKVVVLEDLKFEDLKSLIAFVYQGQVTVPKDRLQDFVSAAESLQIKGLANDLVHEMPKWKNEGENDSVRVGTATSTTIHEENLNEWAPVDNASTTPLVPNVPHCESIVEPMHKVWVKEMRSWESDEEIVETDTSGIKNEKNINGDLSEKKGASNAACSENEPSVWPALGFRTFLSSCTATQSNKKEVSTQVGTEEPKMQVHVEQECKPIDVNDSVIERVGERGHHGFVEVDKDGMNEEEYVIDRQGMMMGAVEEALEIEITVEQNEGMQDAAPLSADISSMPEKKSYKCPKCPDVFHTVNDLQMHVKDLHRKEPSNCCEVCMEFFAYRHQLEVHMRKHTGERPFQCNVCPMSFRRKAHLSRHMQAHTGERSFQCNICKMSFTRSDHLNTHMRTHTGERPFRCDVCKMTFGRKNHLTTHMQIHTGERPFLCEICERSFGHNCSLKKHMLTHTGERNFHCSICNISFSRSDHFSTHMHTHTGDLPDQT